MRSSIRSQPSPAESEFPSPSVRLQDHFASLADPRRRKVTHPLINIITIDVCAGCRGIWLDRGELEKLIARSVQETGRSTHHDAYDRGPPSSDDHRRGHRRRSWLDIFD